MKYTKISIFSILCAGALLSLADIAIGNKNISKVSAATEIANAKNIESTKSNMVISLNGTGRTVDSDKQVAVYDQPNGNVVRYLKPGTNWKIFKKYYDVDNNWYNLGGNQWVDGSYMVANITSMEEGIYDLCDYREYEDCPIIKVRCNSNAGIRVWAAPGIKPTGKCLPNGSSWKVLKIYYHNSDVWYNLGGNQWVSKKGTVYLENKFYK